MNDFDRIKDLTSHLDAAVASRDLGSMASAFEALEQAYQEEYGDSIGGVENFPTWCRMQVASLKYLSFGNFYGKANDLANDLLERIEGCLQESMSEETRNDIESLRKSIDGIKRGLKPKHMNMVINRLDSRCCLCRKNIANKTGAHMVPNFLAHPTFAVDDKGKRDREALNHTFLNGPEWNGSYYGPQAAERMQQVFGHIPTEEEIDDNINRLEYDNEYLEQF